MPEPLKNLYSKNFIETLATDISKVYSQFNSKEFITNVLEQGWKDKELKERMRHITICLKKFLPEDYTKAVSILVKTTKLHRKKTALTEKIDFCDLVFPDFVEVYGLDDYEVSIPALEEFTKISSSESAIRHFIIRYPEKTMKQMLFWAKNPNHKVRRLASEGSRPRLPWTIALNAYKKDPTPILPILEILKEDSSLYVRRSVANNLNDISKDNPEIVLQLAQKWIGKNEDTNWILKHACRGLLKKGNPTALKIFGFNVEAKKIEVNHLSLKKDKIKIGETLFFSFDLFLKEKKGKKLRLEYAIDYVKSNGKLSRKVFILTEKEFQPETNYSFHRKQSFRDMTTRVHYTGTHSLTILINGLEYQSIQFEVIR
ncbi:MAG: DNA alkylation repair protein [Leptospiraceae bacterium]|nr:DNA alkylation repair protein [Leptospiraceae bacterium]